MKSSYLANILRSNLTINVFIINICEALTKTCNFFMSFTLLVPYNSFVRLVVLVSQFYEWWH